MRRHTSSGLQLPSLSLLISHSRSNRSKPIWHSFRLSRNSVLQDGCLHAPPPSYKLLPINFLFVKLNHHLLGLSDPSSYIRANNLPANSCRTWARYCRRASASCLFVGGLNIYRWCVVSEVLGIWRNGGASTWLRGNPGSPGMEKLLSRAIFWTSFCASLL